MNNNNLPARVCRTCRRPLKCVMINDELYYGHAIQDALFATHLAYPAILKGLTPKIRCDFCNTQSVSWVVAARSFEIGFDDSNGMYRSNGSWAACDICFFFVATDQWLELATYSITRRERDGVTVSLRTAGMIRKTFLTVAENMIGEILPFDSHDTDNDNDC